jgi:hypothetical protein
MTKKIQIALLLALVVVGARTAYVLHERHAEALAKKTPAPPLNADYYITPKKLYPYDLKSARQLTQQPVWVKVGYSSTYYPYDAARHRVDFAHESGQLLPLEKLNIVNVVTGTAPSAPGQTQVMAVFEKAGKTYAFSIGAEQDSNYHIYSDDMLFVQDPHLLYKHWPSEVWDAIDKHEVKPGMNELQADFAVGLGIPEGSGSSPDRTVDYANGGKPLTVTYRSGKVSEVRPAS